MNAKQQVDVLRAAAGQAGSARRRSRRQFRRELDAMTERWLRAEGRNLQLRGENELLLAELSRVAAGLRRSWATQDATTRPAASDPNAPAVAS